MIAAAATAALALLSAFSLTVTDAQQQCDVAVLFESHCPDSKNFIHNELIKIWHKLEPHCSLDLVPFGKSRSTATGFSCQHGEKECKGNMVMSCAYRKLTPGRKQLNFTSCFMADPDFGGPECAASNGIQWADIEQCMQSGEGTLLQKDAEQKSYNIRLSRFVPTVIINKTYKQSDQNEAVSGSFSTLMCRYINSEDICI